MTRKITQHVSLQPAEKQAARYLADRLDRGNVSNLIGRLIRREAKQEIGSDWEGIVQFATAKEEDTHE